ncbi:MAG: GNAT family N-acetyltransferase [Chloroflexia bacterium]|nr:GNAT family N-acetyltransferase [Chloroflexia bacterium]
MGNSWDGSLIRLRAVEAADAEAHWRFNGTDDYGLIDRVYPPGSLARVQEWATRRSLAAFDDGTYAFQMESIATGELVGGIATHDCDARTGVLSYGLHVFEEHRGKGHAKEAICLVLRYYFQELRYQKANAGVYSFNEPSIRLHESLGFQLEGRLRRNVYTSGEFFDLLWYGLTVEEFRERHASYWRTTD